MKTTANAFSLLATNNHSDKPLRLHEMQKITNILQNRLLKFQKFKNALILSQIKEIQLFYYSAINRNYQN